MTVTDCARVTLACLAQRASCSRVHCAVTRGSCCSVAASSTASNSCSCAWSYYCCCCSCTCSWWYRHLCLLEQRPIVAQCRDEWQVQMLALLTQQCNVQRIRLRLLCLCSGGSDRGLQLCQNAVAIAVATESQS